LNAKVGKISWISRISEFCSNVFKVLTRNPLSFSSPDSCLTLSKAWKRVNKAVFQKWSFPKVTERRIFEFLAILNSAKLAKPLKKAVFQKWSLSEETERRIFSHSWKKFYTKTREKIMEASRFTRNCNFTTVLNKNDFRALCRNQRKNYGSL